MLQLLFGKNGLKQMYVIGLSGGIGSGKSSVAHYLASLGIPVFDSDAVIRSCVGVNGPCLQQVEELLGPESILPTREMNRLWVADKVFHDQVLLIKFDKILKDQLYVEAQRFLAELRARGTRVVVLDVPLLIESDWREDVDSIWLVKTPKEIRIQRAMRRDHVSEAEMTKRINSQRPTEEVEKYANVIIDNSGDFEHTKVQLLENLRKVELGL